MTSSRGYTCEKCETRLAPDARSCPNCGNLLLAEAPPMGTSTGNSIGYLKFAFYVLISIIATSITRDGIRLVLGSCSPKLGCAGDIMFSALVSGLAGLISGLSVGLSLILYRRSNRALSTRTGVAAGVMTGLLLSLVLRPMLVGPFQQLALVLAWFIVSAVICTLVIHAVVMVSNLTQGRTDGP